VPANAAANQLAARLLAGCEAGGLHLMLAESLTGGLLADALISVPGASRVVLGSVVAYDSRIKGKLLGVPAEVIADFGVVSDQTAAAMAVGARDALGSVELKVIGVATTGVAGPDLVEGKPVGRVHIAVATADGVTRQALQFFGDRQEIREQAVEAALQMTLEAIAD